MYVVYYIEPNSNIKNWKRGQKEKLEEFIKENDIIDYEIAIDEYDYNQLKIDLKSTERQLTIIKTNVEAAMENVMFALNGEE